MSYNFTQKAQVRKYEVQIDPLAKYGYFEHEVYGEERGGGLWFEEQDGKLTLTDYDGLWYLPKAVAEAIVQLGHIVEPHFTEN